MDLQLLLEFLYNNDVFFLFLCGAFLCYLPMRNQLRFSFSRLLIHGAVLLVINGIGIRFLEAKAPEVNSTIIILPFLFGCFIYYYYSVRANVVQVLAVFFGVCTLLAIPGYLALILKEIILGGAVTADSHVLAAGIQVGLSLLEALLLVHTLAKSGAYLIDNISQRNIWIYTIPFSLITFILLNYLAPEEDGWFRDLEMRQNHLIVFVGTSALYLLLLLFFGRVSLTLKQDEELRSQEAIFQMQRKQYDEINSFLKQSQVYRHDMRHQMRILNELATAGDFEELTRFIHKINEDLPENPVKYFCKDTAINALLNFYADEMRKENVKADFQIDLPAMLSRQLVDLSGLLSNLLENALLACCEVTEGERQFALTIRTMNQKTLYIVSSNTFSGRIRHRRGKYLSTRLQQGGSGIGLQSMQTIAERYGGSMTVYHKEKVFFVDIMMKVAEAL